MAYKRNAVPSSVWHPVQVGRALLMLLALAGCADHKAVPTPDSSNPGDTDALPGIEARLYRVRAVKMSESGKVYLLDRLAASAPPSGQPDEIIPPERKLLMLKSGQDNVMALRVLKDLPDTHQVIAKKIRQYGDNSALPLNTEYIAVEKISDIAPPPPTEQDNQDIQEVTPPPAFDPELDAATSPSPDEDSDPAGSDGDDEDSDLGKAIQDTEANDTHRNWLTFEVGELRNTPNGSSTYNLYAGGGFRYGYDFAQHLFFAGGNKYDAFGVDFGVFYYKIVNLSSVGGDSYIILPLIGVLKYTVFYSEEWAFSAYGGLMKNLVLSSTPPSGVSATDSGFQQTVSNLRGLLPAFGLGVMARVGPGWYVRADLGTDTLGVGISLRF